MSLTSELNLYLAGLTSDIRVKTKEIENIKEQVKNIHSLEEYYLDLYMKDNKFYSNEAKFFADKAYVNLSGCDGDRINAIPYVIHFSNSGLHNIYYDCYIHIGNIYDYGIKLIPNWKDRIINYKFTYANEIVESVLHQLKDKINKELQSSLYEQEILEEKIRFLKNINLE
jgi:hypothetical protein